MRSKKFLIGEIVVCTETFTETRNEAPDEVYRQEYQQGAFYQIGASLGSGAVINGFPVNAANFDKFERLFS